MVFTIRIDDNTPPRQKARDFIYSLERYLEEVFTLHLSSIKSELLEPLGNKSLNDSVSHIPHAVIIYGW